MDATCTIQDSIHVFNLVHKYVSRILGTYQFKNKSEGNLGYNKITHPNIVFLFGEFVLSNTKQKEPMIRELFHNFIGSAS